MIYSGVFDSEHVMRILIIFISGLSDGDMQRLRLSPSERSDLVEEITTEISVYLGILYHLIQVFKGHDDFADELSKSTCSCSIVRDIISELQ
jgi:hypothetical protein